MAQGEKILEVNNLTINFKTDGGLVQAVRGVSFDLSRGETLCIVGESGSGKSVTSKAIMGILAGNAIVEQGSIMYNGENLLEVSEDEFHRIRGHKIGMIFQDPLSSLNPIVRIGKQITEAMLINSNKLKNMFDDIIAPELTAYKNLIQKRKIKIEKEKHVLNEKLAQLSAQLVEASPERKVEINEQIKAAKAEYKAYVNGLDEKIKEHLPGLKAKLEAKKVEAREIVNKFKQEAQYVRDTKLGKRKAQYEEEVAELQSSYSGEEVKARLNEAKQQYKQDVTAIKEEYINKTKITKAEAKKRALEIMKEVGIPLPEKRFNQYPFEFSGGMRQRIVIAIALTAAPEILICDEPTTALDVTIQAQILELIKRIQRERNIACIFITHDLGVVANMADRVAVMYAGKIVEYGKSEEIFYDPKHPYTWALLSSIPDVDSKERLEAIPGTPPNMIYPPKGDAFAARSKYAMKIDFEEQPPYFKVSETHYAATWLLHPDAPKVEMPKIVSERIKNALKGSKGGEANE